MSEPVRSLSVPLIVVRSDSYGWGALPAVA
jgi:hypothetical protein